jgi:hypothetical protein
MSPVVPRPTAPPPTASPWWKLVDWRTVAAVGLPLWAFVLGVVVAHKPSAPPVPSEGPPAVAVAPAPADEGIPPPREIVVRTPDPQVIAVPAVVAVPVAVAAAHPVPPAEFRLPDAELMPDNKCKTFDTKVKFHRGPAEAAAEAKASKRMMFVLHISGNFEDPGFT